MPEFVDTTTAITSLVIYGVLTFLVIKGLRWGYVVFLAWWVIDKAVTIWASVTEGYASSVVSGFVFLAIGVILLIKGIKIENARHKLMNQEAT